MKISRWLAVLLCFCFAMSMQVGWAQKGDGKYSQVLDVPRQEINEWLKSEVERSGGNFGKDRYAFLIGFDRFLNRALWTRPRPCDCHAPPRVFVTQQYAHARRQSVLYGVGDAGLGQN